MPMTARKDGHLDPWCNGSLRRSRHICPRRPRFESGRVNNSTPTDYGLIQEQARRAVEAAECGTAHVAPGITRQGDEGTRRQVQARLRTVAADGEKYTVVWRRREPYSTLTNTSRKPLPAEVGERCLKIMTGLSRSSNRRKRRMTAILLRLYMTRFSDGFGRTSILKAAKLCVRSIQAETLSGLNIQKGALWLIILRSQSSRRSADGIWRTRSTSFYSRRTSHCLARD